LVIIVVMHPGRPKINISVAQECHRNSHCFRCCLYLGSRRRQRVSR
jgi:hypothetical protein